MTAGQPIPAGLFNIAANTPIYAVSDMGQYANMNMVLDMAMGFCFQ